MKEKTLYQLRAGAFTCGVFLRDSWGKTILRITIRKAIGGLKYREFTFSNSRELEDLAVLLQAIKKNLNSVLRKETCSPSFLFLEQNCRPSDGYGYYPALRAGIRSIYSE